MAQTPASPILVVGGSVRPHRISPQVAQWVADLGRQATPLAWEVVDLREVGLAMDAEPDIPARGGGYADERTRAWSQRVASSCCVVFVTPQYNWGYPAPLKNAIDLLYREWKDRPAAIVSYGGHGGGKAAAQLRQVVEAVGMRLAATSPALTLRRERIEANTGEIDAQTEFAADAETVRQALRELAELVASSAA